MVRRPMGDRGTGPRSAQLDTGSWPPDVTTRNLMYGGQSLSRTGHLTTHLAHLLHWQLLRRLQRHRRPQNGFFCFSSRRGRKKGFSGRSTAGSIGSSGCHPRRDHQHRPLRARSGERPQRYLADFSISLLSYSPATLRGPERVHDWVLGKERYHIVTEVGYILLSDFSTIHTPRS